MPVFNPPLIVEDEGLIVTQRPFINFVGAGVNVTDNAPNNSSDVTITGGGGAGHTHDGTGGGASLVIGGVNEAGATIPTATTAQSVAMGDYANAGTSQGPIAIGSGLSAISAPSATGQGSLAIGGSNDAAVTGARASGITSIAIGAGTAAAVGALASATDSIAIGRTSSAAHANAVAIGDGVSTTAASQVNIGTKRAFLGAPTTAPADADLINNQISFWLNETDSTLVIKVKTSAGTVKTFLGELA